MKDSLLNNTPLSLYIHLPWCETQCPYCDFSITTDPVNGNDAKLAEAIIKDMISGLDPIQKKKVLAITDRRQAIMTAGKLAKQNDIILIAGKGHEKYQEIKGEKIPFDDMHELKQSLNIMLN